MRMPRAAFILVLVAMIPAGIVAPPVIPEEAKDSAQKNNNNNNKEMDLGLTYERYLKEVIESLEEDKEFRDKLTNAKMEDITSGKIANELQFVSHHIRSKLDELKRSELRRLRSLGRQEERRMLGMPPILHVDDKNEHTFEIKDLRRLMQKTTKDLEEIDRQRREEFKGYEMEKEHRRREELKRMDEEKRKRAEAEYAEKQKRHQKHPKLHHPGSKQQLEEVWEQEDRLPTEEFNPKTFFMMHDMDGDNFWSEEEVKSLFQHELDKMYDQNNTDDDMRERREEMERMREHVVNETDTNNDGLISISEFMEMTRRNEFNQDPGWQGLDEQEMFREEEFREYERQYQAGMIPPGGVPIYGQGGVHPGAGYQHLQDPQMGGHQMYPPQPQGYPQQNPGQFDHQNYIGGPPQYQQQQPPPQQYPHQQGYPQGQAPQFQGHPQGQAPQFQGHPQGFQGQAPQFQGPPQGQYVQQQQQPPQQHHQGYQPQQQPQQQQAYQPQQQQGYQPQQQGYQPQQQQPQQQQQPNLQNAQVVPSSSDHPQPDPPKMSSEAAAATTKQP